MVVGVPFGTASRKIDRRLGHDVLSLGKSAYVLKVFSNRIANKLAVSSLSKHQVVQSIGRPTIQWESNLKKEGMNEAVSSES